MSSSRAFQNYYLLSEFRLLGVAITTPNSGLLEAYPTRFAGSLLRAEDLRFSLGN